MLGATAGEVLDLLTTGDAGSDDLGLRRRGLHGRRQPAVAQRDGDVVVLALEAEGAGHPAAPRIHLGDLEPGPAERRHRRRGAHQRLLVTVPVEQRLAAVAAELQREAAAAL